MHAPQLVGSRPAAALAPDRTQEGRDALPHPREAVRRQGRGRFSLDPVVKSSCGICNWPVIRSASASPSRAATSSRSDISSGPRRLNAHSPMAPSYSTRAEPASTARSNLGRDPITLTRRGWRSISASIGSKYQMLRSEAIPPLSTASWSHVIAQSQRCTTLTDRAGPSRSWSSLAIVSTTGLYRSSMSAWNTRSDRPASSSSSAIRASPGGGGSSKTCLPCLDSGDGDIGHEHRWQADHDGVHVGLPDEPEGVVEQGRPFTKALRRQPQRLLGSSRNSPYRRVAIIEERWNVRLPRPVAIANQPDADFHVSLRLQSIQAGPSAAYGHADGASGV